MKGFLNGYRYALVGLGACAALALVLVLVSLGCNRSPVAAAKTRPPVVAYSPQMSNKFWDIAKLECRTCHQATYNGAYTAGINLLTKSSLTSSQVQMIYDAISYEKAPAGRMLASVDRDSILRWAYQNGATPYDVTVPSTFFWSESLQIGNTANGTDAQSPGLFYGFAVEDLNRGTMQITTYTDRDGLTKKCLEFWEVNNVNTDSVPTTKTTHRVNYIVPDGVAWAGRIKEFHAEGYITQSGHSGVFFHTRTLKKHDIGVYQSTHIRERREYVRVQMNDDYVALRGKKVGTVDDVETWPWSGAPTDPWLVAQSGYGLYAQPTLYNDKFYWMEIDATLSGGVMTYHVKLKTSKNGSTVSEIGATRSSTGEAFGGFGFFQYSSHSHRVRVANWTWTGNSMYGAGAGPGNGTGCRPPCELE